MIFTVLSCFDNIMGPQIFCITPDTSNSIYLDHVPLLMDLYKEGFFVHECGDIRTANLIFEIYSCRARGRREILMISIVSTQETFHIDLGSFRDLLVYYALQLRSIPDVYQGFHMDEITEAKDKFTQIMDLTYTFHNSLPTERQIYDQMFSQVLTLQLSPEGKSTILQRLQQKLSHSNQSTINMPSLSDIKF